MLKVGYIKPVIGRTAPPEVLNRTEGFAFIVAGSGAAGFDRVPYKQGADMLFNESLRLLGVYRSTRAGERTSR